MKKNSISLSDARNEHNTVPASVTNIVSLPSLLVTEQRAVNVEHCTYNHHSQHPFVPLQDYPNVDFPISFWFADILFGNGNLCDVLRSGIEAKHNADLDAFDNSLYLEYFELEDLEEKKNSKTKNQTEDQTKQKTEETEETYTGYTTGQSSMLYFSPAVSSKKYLHPH